MLTGSRPTSTSPSRYPDAFTNLDERQHVELRRTVSRLYSLSSVSQPEGRVKSYAAMLAEGLSERAAVEGAIDLAEWISWYSRSARISRSVLADLVVAGTPLATLASSSVASLASRRTERTRTLGLHTRSGPTCSVHRCGLRHASVHATVVLRQQGHGISRVRGVKGSHAHRDRIGRVRRSTKDVTPRATKPEARARRACSTASSTSFTHRERRNTSR